MAVSGLADPCGLWASLAQHDSEALGGTDLANSAIIEPYLSRAKAPYGFPLDEAKWRVESLDDIG